MSIGFPLIMCITFLLIQIDNYPSLFNEPMHGSALNTNKRKYKKIAQYGDIIFFHTDDETWSKQ